MLKTTKEWTEKLKSAIVKSEKLESCFHVSKWRRWWQRNQFPFSYRIIRQVKSSQEKMKERGPCNFKEKESSLVFELPCSLTSIRVCSRRRIHRISWRLFLLVLLLLLDGDTVISTTTREDVTKLVNTLFFEICRCFCYTRCTSELLVNLHIQSFAELPESSLRVYFGDR